MKNAISTFLLSAVALVGALTAGFGIRSVLHAGESSRWPSTSGTVIRSEMREKRGTRSGLTYHADVEYEYTVNEQRHTSKRVAFGDYGTSNPGHARSILNRYPKGKAVTVYYSPADPQNSVLENGLKAQAFFVPGVGLLFLAVPTVILVALRRQANRDRLRNP